MESIHAMLTAAGIQYRNEDNPTRMDLLRVRPDSAELISATWVDTSLSMTMCGRDPC